MNTALRRFAAAAGVLFALAGGVLAAGLPAEPPPAAASTDAAVAPPAPDITRPALWKVADRDTTIYLFGTVHVLPKGIAWYRGDIARAFEQSHELVTEIVEDVGPQAQSAMLAFRRVPPVPRDYSRWR